ncbi:MAG: TerB family tellurite resistance protein [Deltaproteobacteria bacterium]|jgi:hypothetical protein|nr:TerB family tellurite resistance protein [Deltaproteobacteria bacterium]MBT4265896.1 TerB family tellurite resistance protein [Deltaproteobacteria bacterium]MBT4643682.1 TerB family tellurite resistance protein [Deltaproteobacteria bacterium]MBT6503229.1 TerB family tellurite resistance protein [Deltaproteobacteria bacterium]MBT6612949.1 TerB family tellurite resistance protein [Deltaproteobacteria bacterium]
MKEVTRSDMFLIFKAAAQMSSIDSDVAEQETLFLNKLAQTARLSSGESKKLQSTANEDVEILADKLSSPKAKKVFLLAVATMAKADQHLSDEEINMLEKLTLRLKIGRVKIKEMSYKACEDMVLKLLAQTVGNSGPDQKKKGSGDKFSDLDML